MKIDTEEREESRSRISAWILQGGNEPDPRFTLANERTFLAWIRTSLALVTGGVAVEAFMADLFGPELRKTVSILLLTTALLIGSSSFFRYVGVERAMRHKQPLPLPWIAPLLSACAAVAAVAMVLFVLARPN